MPGSRPARGLVALTLLGLALHVSGATEAAFAVSTGTPAMSLSSAADWKPPIVSRAVILKAEGGIPGFVRQGGSYVVYAAVADDASSRPASGVGAVVAGMTGLPPMDLVAGTATVLGEHYSHQTPPRSEAYAPAGSYSAWVRGTDQATPRNTSAEYPIGVVVDNTAPRGALLTVTNRGTANRPDPRDEITFTWNEVVDPDSIVDGWDGAARDVTVRITDSTATGGDVLTVIDRTTGNLLPLGQIALGGNYVSGDTTFGAAGTRSRLSWTAAETGFTVVLGTQSAGNTVITGSTTAATTTWTPAAGVFDRAGNRSATAPVIESGTADRDF